MSRTLVRGVIARAVWAWAVRRMRDLDEASLQGSALVFAPHPDDETLGCGGTIRRKRDLGAEVAVAFMTDGRKSHHHLMSIEELVTRRMEEGRSACQVLGVDAENLSFLGFEDGRLGEQGAAVEATANLIRRFQPEQMFVPCWYDPPADHVATRRAVQQAVETCRWTGTLFEYPVWYWNHWPWVKWTQMMESTLAARCRRMMHSWFHLSRDFAVRIPVGDVIEVKRKALACHRTQMERLTGNPDWATLEDVWEGDFLACHFRPFEVFCCRTVTAGRVGSMQADAD